MGMTPQHTPSVHLVPFCHHLHKYALCLLVVCREGLWKAVHEVGSGGCVVCFDVHGEWVMLWVAAMCLLYWAWQIWSVLTVCRNCAMYEQCWVCMVCWSLSYAVKFFCCWTWQIWVTILYCTVLHHNIVRLMVVAMVILCIKNLPPP